MEHFIAVRTPLSEIAVQYTPQMLVRMVGAWYGIARPEWSDEEVEDKKMFELLFDDNVVKPVVDRICELAGSTGILSRNALSGAVVLKRTGAVVAGDVSPRARMRGLGVLRVSVFGPEPLFSLATSSLASSPASATGGLWVRVGLR